MSGKVWAISMVKDEQDIIGQTISNLYEQGIDGILIYDNMSNDRTVDILVDLQSQYPNFVIGVDSDIAYYQSTKMTNIAKEAVTDYGAEYIIPLDADEWWFSNEGNVAEIMRTKDIDVYFAPVWHMVALHDNDPDPVKNMTYRMPNPEKFPVVAFKWRDGTIIAQGNHSVQYPGEASIDTATLQVRHYQYRSFEQFCSKVRNGKAAYDATDLPEGEGAHWRTYGALSDIELWNVWTSLVRQATPEELIVDVEGRMK